VEAPPQAESSRDSAGSAVDSRTSEDSEEASAPDAGFMRSAYVDPGASTDGVLSLLILGDEQAASWAEGAVVHLQERLADSPAPWSSVRVEASIQANAGWTAANAWNFLEQGGWADESPELVLLAVGWHDAATPRARETPPVDAATPRLAEFIKQAVFQDRREGQHDFYLRRALEGLEGEHLSPEHHLELLDGIALRGAENGAAVLYVEQPARHSRGERSIFPTTAARPQPWLATVGALERLAMTEALFEESSPIALTAQGAANVARYVGLGAAPAVLGTGRPRSEAATNR
jgi:hypothetical protein